MLWRMLSTAGMAEYTIGMKRRLTSAHPSARPHDEDNNDEENDDDDVPLRPASGASSRSRRGNPHPATKRRKKGDGGHAPPTPPPPPAQTKQAPVQRLPFGSPDSFDLKWVDFRLDVLAAKRARFGENWQKVERAEKRWEDGRSETCEYSSDNAESISGSEYSDEE